MRGLSFTRLKSYPLCCAVAATHPLARKRSLRMTQLKQERFIVLSRDDYPEYHEWLREVLLPASFEPQLAQECDSATGIVAAVEAGRGVAIVSTSMKCLTGPRVKLLPFVPALSPVVVGVLSTKSTSSLVERFINAVKQVV
jgi:DNA-binding transcriptional LysR family regulator